MAGPAQFPLLSQAAVKAIILEGYDTSLAGSWVGMLTNHYSSVRATETYVGTGNVAPMREWIGPKQIIPLNQGTFTVTNKDWESTLQLEEKDLRRDGTGQLKSKVGEFTNRAVQHYEKILSSLINTADAATLGLTFDGQYFFDTDHSFGSSGTINNDITFDVATTTAPTPTEMVDAILASIQALYGFKDDHGEPANGGCRNFVVMVPVTFWAATQSANTQQFLTSGVSNRLMGSGVNITPVCNPRLTWTTAFATFATDRPTKPLLIQEEVAPYVESTSRDGDYWFDNHAEKHSIVSSDNVGFQRFDGAVLTTLT
jgi:phage major head subunit gpT-like protein